MVFGKTRLHFYEGLWRRGAYIYRDYLRELGHTLPDNYDPPTFWSSLYNIGWHHNDRQKLADNYNIGTIEQEARKAVDIGCEALCLDAGWEVCEGTTTWDEERLGDVRDFAARIKEEFGLRLGFRTVGRSYCDDYPGMYRRRDDGAVGYYAPYHKKPFYEPCLCCESYREEKLRRILRIADAGFDFVVFDEFDWRGPCHDAAHGHPVPTSPNLHARAAAELVRGIHDKHPHAVVGFQDPVWPWGVRYLPMYHLHGLEKQFDEAWAFEFMWRPLEDLLSGKALSLFYYNLAYCVPLYLYIDMDKDNDNCLAFWWYASTVRHLGIGGGKNNPERFEAYKQAMQEYLSLKDLYTRGDFYGMDELTHLHVLPDEGRCVLNAFNLTDAPISREVDIRLNELGLMQGVEVAGVPHEVSGAKLKLKLDIPAFSPVVVKMCAG